MKIISWNINGFRAFMKKPEYSIILDYDVIALQEIRCQELPEIENFWLFANYGNVKGRNGVSVYVNKRYNAISKIPEFDTEGRVIMVSICNMSFVNVYAINAGTKLARLDYKQTWFALLQDWIKNNSMRCCCIVGDFNTALTDIDLSNPKTNHNTAGFTYVERNAMCKFVSELSLEDVYRVKNPESSGFTFYGYRCNKTERKIGWRIDYCLCKNVNTSVNIDPSIYGSDHIPLMINIEFENAKNTKQSEIAENIAVIYT